MADSAKARWRDWRKYVGENGENYIDANTKPEEAPKVSPEQAPAKEEPAQDSPEEGEQAIRRAAEEFGLAIRETSLCLWLAGDTKPHKDALKKAGAKWSAKKGAWYFRKPQAA